MARLKRIGRTRAVPGVGYALRGVIHTVPDDQVEALLASGEWEHPTVGELGGTPNKAGKDAPSPDVVADAEAVSRVTEPAPTKPAAKKPARKRK